MPVSSPKASNGGTAYRLVRRLTRRPRFNLCAALFAGLVVAFVAGGAGIVHAIVLAFTIASAIFLASIAHLFAHATVASIKRRARNEDPGRWGLLVTSIALSGIVLVSMGLELQASKAGGAPGVALAAAGLLLSWLFMNTMFALHYAHAYYGDGQRGGVRGGLEFPGKHDPDYWDFLYFSVVIGMTFQVSDVQIGDRHLRRIALMQSMAAFLFNVVVIALSVNIVAGKA